MPLDKSIEAKYGVHKQTYASKSILSKTQSNKLYFPKCYGNQIT